MSSPLFSGFRTFGLLCVAAITAFHAAAQAPAKPLKPVTIAVGTQVLNVTYPLVDAADRPGLLAR